MYPVCRGHKQSIIPFQQCIILLFLLFSDSRVTSVKEYLPKMLKLVIEDGAFRKSNLCTSSLTILWTVKRVLVVCPVHAHHAHELDREKLKVAVAFVSVAHELNCAGVYCWMLLMSFIVVWSLCNCGMCTSEKSFHSVCVYCNVIYLRSINPN